MAATHVRAAEFSNDVTRKRILTTCEACRIAESSCQPSPLPDICQRSTQEACSSPSQRSPSGQIGAFNIGSQMPVQDEVDEAFETLQDVMVYPNATFPENRDSPPSPFYTDSSRGFSNTPVASQGPFIDSFQARPQFNIASAERLLQAFHCMLDHYPCISLDNTTTVSELARSRPFVLLAILVAASGPRTLQGRNLYDDEFRKALGLKLVTRGETSLELLQGLLIYCAWYSFHLRAKQRRNIQYLHMATELVQDLELHVDLRSNGESHMPNPTDKALERIRTHLAYCYIVNLSWSVFKTPCATAPSFTPWIDYCCTLLETSQSRRDRILAALSRQSFTSGRALNAVVDAAGGKQDQDTTRLVLLGLAAQNNRHQASLAPHIAASTPVRMQLLYTTICLEVGSLIRLPHERTAIPKSIIATLPKLYAALDAIRNFLSLLMSLEEPVYLRFATMDWTRLVLVTNLALRLSFPIPAYPQYDDEWARSHMKFSEFLDAICVDTGLTPGRMTTDAMSATRAVMVIVRNKYKAHLEKHLAKGAKAAERKNGRRP